MGSVRGHRRLVAIAGVVGLAIAALGITFALRTGDKSSPASPADQLIGIKWVNPGGSIVFTDHTARVFDGCDNQLRQVSIGDGFIDFVGLLASSDCLGRETPPGVFDAVLATDEITWQRTGDTLQLTGGGNRIQLRPDGPALSLTGRDWRLDSFVDFRGFEQPGDPAVRLRIDDDGSVHATDLCNELTGTATVADATITFGELHSTDRSCPDSTLTEVVDRVLSGTARFSIDGNDRLGLSGERRGYLTYRLRP